MFADEDLHRHAVENLDQANALWSCWSWPRRWTI